jgi:hypothetical protein
MSSVVPSQQRKLSKPVLYGLIGCLGIIALLFGCSASEQSVTTKATPAPITTASAIPQKTHEYMLASLDKGYPVEEDDITVKRFRYLLDSLEKKTTNTRQQLADYTFNTQKIAREKYGKDIKLIDLMEQANKAIPPGQKMDYNEIVVMTMVIMANE